MAQAATSPQRGRHAWTEATVTATSSSSQLRANHSRDPWLHTRELGAMRTVCLSGTQCDSSWCTWHGVSPGSRVLVAPCSVTVTAEPENPGLACPSVASLCAIQDLASPSPSPCQENAITSPLPRVPSPPQASGGRQEQHSTPHRAWCSEKRPLLAEVP